MVVGFETAAVSAVDTTAAGALVRGSAAVPGTEVAAGAADLPLWGAGSARVVGVRSHTGRGAVTPAAAGS